MVRKWLCVDRVEGIGQIASEIWAENREDARAEAFRRFNEFCETISEHEFNAWYGVVSEGEWNMGLRLIEGFERTARKV